MIIPRFWHQTNEKMNERKIEGKKEREKRKEGREKKRKREEGRGEEKRNKPKENVRKGLILGMLEETAYYTSVERISIDKKIPEIPESTRPD